MLLLSVGLYVPRPGEIYLDEDACSDLVNRLGANLKRLVSLNLENIISILNRAQIGGYIRWHMLWHVLLNAADEPVSSTYRICENTYIVTLTTVDVSSFPCVSPAAHLVYLRDLDSARWTSGNFVSCYKLLGMGLMSSGSSAWTKSHMSLTVFALSAS